MFGEILILTYIILIVICEKEEISKETYEQISNFLETMGITLFGGSLVNINSLSSRANNPDIIVGFFIGLMLIGFKNYYKKNLVILIMLLIFIGYIIWLTFDKFPIIKLPPS